MKKGRRKGGRTFEEEVQSNLKRSDGSGSSRCHAAREQCQQANDGTQSMKYAPAAGSGFAVGVVQSSMGQQLVHCDGGVGCLLLCGVCCCLMFF